MPLVAAEPRLYSKIHPGDEVILSGNPKHASWFQPDQANYKGKPIIIKPSRIEFVKEYPRYTIVRVFFSNLWGTYHFDEAINKSSGMQIRRAF